MNRRTGSDAPYAYTTDTRGIERGRGYLSGDGQMHGQRPSS